MLLSIITINRNNAAGLQKTIESVKTQTCKNYEHIIIDGASSDDSVKVIQDALKDADYAQHVTYWCSEKDSGIYNAMNKGTKYAKSDYCLYLNSGDCLANTDVLARICSANFTSDIIYANVNYVYKNKTVFKKYDDHVDLLFFYNKGILSHQNMLIKTTIIKAHPYSEKYIISGDVDFYVRAFVQLNCTFTYVNDVFVSFEAEDGIGSIASTLSLRNQEGDEIISDYFSPQLQHCLALLNDYEYGYKGILRRIRKILLFIATKTTRRKNKVQDTQNNEQTNRYK